AGATRRIDVASRRRVTLGVLACASGKAVERDAPHADASGACVRAVTSVTVGAPDAVANDATGTALVGGSAAVPAVEEAPDAGLTELESVTDLAVVAFA